MKTPSKISVEKDITKANLITPDFYKYDFYFEESKHKIFLKSWQFVSHQNQINNTIYPFTFLENLIDEPYIIIKDKEIKILSNICTHRANILCHKKNDLNTIQCNYHGRTFDLNGKLKQAPGFKKVKNFPNKTDDLKNIPIKSWNNFIFTSVSNPINIDGIFNDISNRISNYPFSKLIFDKNKSSTFTIDAHWALYCENYLEGFHVPFIHKGLNADIDYNNYKIEILDHGVLQYTDNKSSLKYNQILNDNIYAYYYWIFPNMMFNFYNWGLSINIVEPINKDKTRIKFLSFPIEGLSQPLGTDSDLDLVEKEDQEVVLSVQNGIKSHHYNKGRYSATHEVGLHYFHQLIARYLD
jgi:choline monooxygenase